MFVIINGSKVEFKEFKPRLKFKRRLKYGWLHIKLYSSFQDLSRGAQLKPVFGSVKRWLKFIKFGHWVHDVSELFVYVFHAI